MAGLGASRNTSEWNGAPRFHYGLIPVEASTSIYVGGMVALNANGNAVPAQALGVSPLNKLSIIGICEYVYAGGIMPPGLNALNQTGNGVLYPGATATLGAAGAISVGVVCSIWGMDVDNSIAQAQVGQMAFAVDDHTVSVLDGSGAHTVANTVAIAGGAAGGMPLFGTTPFPAPIIVLNPYITPGSVTVYSATGATGTKYVENTDYSINYQAGILTAIPGGAITTGETLYVAYKYGVPTKVAAGEIIAIDGGLAYVCMFKQTLRSANATMPAGN
jgi:hypothetical protein